MKTLRFSISLALAAGSLLACEAPPATQQPGGPGNGSDGDAGEGAVGLDSPYDCAESVAGSQLLRRLTRREIENTLIDVFGADDAAGTPLPGDLIEGIRLSNDVATLSMGTQMAQAVLARAEKIADVVTSSSNLPERLPCSASSPDPDCVNSFVGQYGERLFRRPLSDTERERYLNLHQTVSSQSTFAEGIKWVLVALIQSPHALHRSEFGVDGKLTPYELASELSYGFSASPPSIELLALATDGSLDSPEVRVAEAKKLLSSPRGQQVVQHFFEEWLSLSDAENVPRTAPDEVNFQSMRTRMVREARAFLDKLIYEKSGRLDDLMTADYTVADQALAQYYGFPGGSGDLLTGQGEEVQRTYGRGVFAQGAVLTTMASVAITSPTRRGLLLLERLFCQTPGIPEGINFDLTSDAVQGNTTRERLENSHLDTGCRGCHSAFDPLGFAFEHLDHIGRYRTEERNERDGQSYPINASAEVALLGGVTVNSQEELMLELAKSQDVAACVSSTMERYVYGSSGSCRAKDSRIAVSDGDTSIIDFLAQLAAEPHFTNRR